MWRTRPANCSEHDETGSLSIELVIVLPALFAVMFLGMQAALFHHARSVAFAAAQEGAYVAAAEHGTDTAGTRTALAFVAQAGGRDVLADARAHTTRTPTTVRVTVRGTSLSVLPGWRPTITQSASAPVERITTP